jgi:DNA/RNA-binding domain of Phe-tRNA-synthetase-like protein
LWLRLIDGKSLYKINNVVDAQNLVSIQAVRSIGSYDLDKLQGSIVFRPGNEGEHYPSTKKRTMDLAQLPLLADDLGPFGSPTSDSDRALIRPETKRVVSIIYAFDDDREDSSLLAQLNQLRSHFERFCGAENCRTSIVSPGEFIEIHEPSVGIEKGIVV